MNRRFTLTPAALALALALLSGPGAASEGEITRLRAQLAHLGERYAQQERTLQRLEQRLMELEMQQRGRGLPGRELLAQAPQSSASSNEGSAAGATVGAAAAGVASPPPAGSGGEVQRSRGTDVLVQQEHGLFDRRFTLETGLSYTRYDRRQLVLSGLLLVDAIFLGEINLDQSRSNLWTFDVTGRYGVSDAMVVDFNLPFIYRSNQFMSGGVGGVAASMSEATLTTGPRLGDASIGAGFHMLREAAGRPDVVGSVRLRMPSGQHPFGVKTHKPDANNDSLSVPQRIPTGNGVWSATFLASVLKSSDPLMLFANLGYQHNFKRHFDDISSAPNVVSPGEVKLGDAVQWGMGVALAMNEKTSLSLAFSQTVSRATRTRQDGAGWSKVIGSEANSAMFSAGLTHALNERMSLVATVGLGLTPDAPDFTVGLKFPYTF
ncbi:MAG: transporter [Betaproteobacteria bacterium]|nr:transporter [Betaproteobacteria bacterium]